MLRMELLSIFRYIRHAVHLLDIPVILQTK